MRASRTALMVAAYRGRATAAGQLIDDPWAARLAGEDGTSYAARLDEIYPWMQLWIALRTVFIDGLVLGRDPHQVVVLGAGLDTRAARLARNGRRFFEVDQPSSSAAKQQRILELDDYPAAAAAYVTCDFETQDFLLQLVAAGFQPEEPTLFIWEGVTPYLSEEAIRATLTRIASCHPQSLVTFDYVSRNMGRDNNLRPNDRGTRDLVEDMGEPIRFGTDDPLPLLFDSGFRWIRNVRFDELALGWDGSYDRSRGMRFQSMCVASREARVEIG